MQLFLLAVFGLWLSVLFNKNSPRGEWQRNILAKIGSRGLAVGFVVSLLSVIISLIYSDVIGYAPCKLCWIQRIFLYPQVIILGLAIWKKTKDAGSYCLALSTVGAVVAAYQFYGQSFNSNILGACAADGGPSCTVRYFVEFGYVTIPLMSLTVFLLLIMLMFLNKNAKAV